MPVRQEGDMRAKDRHRLNLLKYLGNWENEWPKRVQMHDILGITRATFRHHFSPADLTEIEHEGLELRKKNSSRERAEVYKAMLKVATKGNVKAMREFLDRTEGKVKEKLDVSLASDLSDEEIDQRIMAMLSRMEKKTKLANDAT